MPAPWRTTQRSSRSRGRPPRPTRRQRPDRELVERLFEAFNRRDAGEIEAVCDEALDFFPVATAEAVGRTAPYVGPAGLRDYLGDVDRAWEELRVTPTSVERRNGSLLVGGRVHVRSRELGIRDVPMAWIWTSPPAVFVRGEVFPRPRPGACCGSPAL